ncbi:MAG: ATP-binding protein [Deltaproteobacteria bacterium]|nr:ATP-binding protein [Deltaproteobacteria bacterium]
MRKMPAFARKRIRQHNTEQILDLIPDKNEQFVLSRVGDTLIRHIFRYPVLDPDTLEVVCWILGDDRKKLGEYLSGRFGEENRQSIEESLSESVFHPDEYVHVIWRIIAKRRQGFHREMIVKIRSLVQRKIEKNRYKGQSNLKKNLRVIRDMFGLTKKECEFCMFLYILSSYEPVEAYFVNHLGCRQYSGRPYLANALNMNKGEVNHILNGKLEKIGFFEIRRYDLNHDLCLKDDFRSLFENPSSRMISKNYFVPLAQNGIPLDHHFVGKKEIAHTLTLLREKPESSNHILLYGAPGTGKTSFAAGIAEETGIPSYGIIRGESNTTQNRRAAIMACMNMTNSGPGSLMVVDEADNLLNTQNSWFMRGETQDKGWMNELLETPGLRMIWITNRIEDMEPSVLRRFAFSLHFKPFNKRQRIQLWDNILEKNKAKQFLHKREIADFAEKYRVSAGAVDLAVKKAKEVGLKTEGTFQEGVALALKAHETLLNDGEVTVNRDRTHKGYSLDGLNIKGDVNAVMAQLEGFDAYLRRSSGDAMVNMNLLFYGPPGAGKSELARYIGKRLDREIICKRASDIQSKYVGDSEKNIRNAFEEAEREEAILIIDEAESLLFNRDRAQRSWEISLTNEFLTSMERFRGILICTSNRMKDLDAASIRRFNHKLHFDFLTSEGNVIFYRKLISAMVQSPLDGKNENCLRGIENLSPGDFKTVIDRHTFLHKKGLKHHVLVMALEEEARIKKIHCGGNVIGF